MFFGARSNYGCTWKQNQAIAMAGSRIQSQGYKKKANARGLFLEETEEQVKVSTQTKPGGPCPVCAFASSEVV